MNELFLEIINMSISASWLVLAVLLLRMMLKKAPKWVNVLLWGIVAVRLICPFSIESPLSLIPDSIGSGDLVSQWTDDYIGDIDIHHPDSADYDAAIGAGREPIYDGEDGYYVITKRGQLEEPATIENTVVPILTVVWLIGMAALVLYTAISYLHLCRKVDTAVRYRGNIFQSENVVSPFVLGIIIPKIYLPFHISETDMEYVIAHEQAHIHRKDHVWKPLGFLLLTIHWFNPLVWLSYILMCRDIELACDEKVIRKLGSVQRAGYTQALVSCSVNRRIIAACPLAFGEIGVKERVKSVMNYKKPAFWVSILAVIACISVAIFFLTNPEKEYQGKITITEESTQHSEQDAIMQDLAYYLELSASDLAFQAMADERKEKILSEYGNLLDGYTLMARESTDGKTEYIVGCYEGDAAQSPLHKMQAMDISPAGVQRSFQVLYLEENYERLDKKISTEGISAVTSEGYVLKDSLISWTLNREYFMIQPVGSAQDLSETFYLYYDSSKGSAYIEDALARGIAFNTVAEPYLRVSLFSEKYGDITERIALSKEQADTILSEEQQELADGFDIAATLEANGESIYFGVSGVPQTVLDLAIEKCGYRFETPANITAPIKEARLDCSWLENPVYAERSAFTRLEEILKGAEYSGVGNCGYEAKLTLSLENGEVLTIFKGTDDCGSLVFGSGGGYSLSDEADDEFWKIFGLPVDAEERF